MHLLLQLLCDLGIYEMVPMNMRTKVSKFMAEKRQSFVQVIFRSADDISIPALPLFSVFWELNYPYAWQDKFSMPLEGYKGGHFVALNADSFSETLIK